MEVRRLHLEEMDAHRMEEPFAFHELGGAPYGGAPAVHTCRRAVWRYAGCTWRCLATLSCCPLVQRLCDCSDVLACLASPRGRAPCQIVRLTRVLYCPHWTSDFASAVTFCRVEHIPRGRTLGTGCQLHSGQRGDDMACRALAALFTLRLGVVLPHRRADCPAPLLVAPVCCCAASCKWPPGCSDDGPWSVRIRVYIFL